MAHSAHKTGICRVNFQVGSIWFLVSNSSSYRLSHATMLSYFRPTSPVGHLEQFVLPTAPCHHVLAAGQSVEGTSKYCQQRQNIQLVITTEPFDYWAFRHSRGLLPTVYLSVWLGCADRQPGLSAGLLAGNRLALLPEIWLLPENRHGNERKKAVRREEGFL